MVEQLFLSPQVKQSAIISNKYGIHELPHEMPNDLIRKLSKLGTIKKISKFHRIIASGQYYSQNEDFVNTSKNLLKNRN